MESFWVAIVLLASSLRRVKSELTIQDLDSKEFFENFDPQDYVIVYNLPYYN